ncbi:putative CAMK family protein kinase [Blattamonas nauphoetae]|uniref:non-specific serine/threonine protein kinase n=1 Tax=Blattamonas nauphoetae TaxID=2049346 RepID=A0ABQ9YH86_9EUKA|nr:putative CAMK family protein kinase [Blattamonas nauphoetae]
MARLGNFEFQESLVQGEQELWICLDRSLDIQVLIQRIPYTQPQELQNVLEDIEILVEIQSEYILQTKEEFHDNTHIYLVMEFCPGGTLHDLVTTLSENNRSMTAEFFTQIWKELILGLQVYHSHSIVLRQFKPSTIFLTEDGHAKIAYLGSSLFLYSYNHVLSSAIPNEGFYLSPEILQSRHYSMASDLWALACIFLEVYMLRPLFIVPPNAADPASRSVDETLLFQLIQIRPVILKQIMEESIIDPNEITLVQPLPFQIDSQRAGFINRLLSFDPISRPTIGSLSNTLVSRPPTTTRPTQQTSAQAPPQAQPPPQIHLQTPPHIQPPPQLQLPTTIHPALPTHQPPQFVPTVNQRLTTAPSAILQTAPQPKNIFEATPAIQFPAPQGTATLVPQTSIVQAHPLQLNTQPGIPTENAIIPTATLSTTKNLPISLAPLPLNNPLAPQRNPLAVAGLVAPENDLSAPLKDVNLLATGSGLTDPMFASPNKPTLKLGTSGMISSAHVNEGLKSTADGKLRLTLDDITKLGQRAPESTLAQAQEIQRLKSIIRKQEESLRKAKEFIQGNETGTALPGSVGEKAEFLKGFTLRMEEKMRANPKMSMEGEDFEPDKPVTTNDIINEIFDGPTFDEAVGLRLATDNSIEPVVIGECPFHLECVHKDSTLVDGKTMGKISKGLSFNTILLADAVFSEGVIQCAFKVHDISQDNGITSILIGILDVLHHPPVQNHGMGENSYSAAFDISTGNMKHNHNITSSLMLPVEAGSIVTLEANLYSKPRTLHLFVNGRQQGGYYINIPKPMRFGVSLGWGSNCLEVLALNQIEFPTVDVSRNVRYVKW